MTRRSTTTPCCLVCILDIIWNAVEDEYLTVIMYTPSSIPLFFLRETSRIIHNERNDVGSRTAYLEATHASGALEQSLAWRITVRLASWLHLEPYGRNSVRP